MNHKITAHELQSFCFEVPFTENTPILVAGDGTTLTAHDGKQYIDALSGIFVVGFGYGCEPIIEAMAGQLRRLAFSPPLHGVNEPALQLADELVRLAPSSFDCVKLVSGGSESIELAVRMARVYHAAHGHSEKSKTISNYHGYHGSTQGALSLTGRPDVWRFGPRVPGTLHVWAADCAACPFSLNYPDCHLLCASMVEQTIKAEGPDSIAALIIEPVVHLLGMAVAPKEYLQEIRRICDDYEIVLIFDEIVTGFGRAGASFAASRFEIEPDLLCFGKGVSGGYAPLAGVLISERISDRLRDPVSRLAAFAPSHTYAGNPVSAAAGLAAVKLLKDEHCLPRINQLGDRLRTELSDNLGEQAIVQGVGLLAGLKIRSSRPEFTLRTSVGKHIEAACLARGVIVRGEADWVAVAPPYVTSDETLARIIEVVSEEVLAAA